VASLQSDGVGQRRKPPGKGESGEGRARKEAEEKRKMKEEDMKGKMREVGKRREVRGERLDLNRDSENKRHKRSGDEEAEKVRGECG
jgi:hypothetical protein